MTDTVDSIGLPLLGIALGGGVGATIAKKIDMRDLPQLMAGFHSLVGLGRRLCGLGCIFQPRRPMGIGEVGAIGRQFIDRNGVGRGDWCDHVYWINHRLW